MSMITEIIHWHDPAAALPAEATAVLIEDVDGNVGEASLYHGAWYWTGMVIVEEPVTAWAALPSGARAAAGVNASA